MALTDKSGTGSAAEAQATQSRLSFRLAKINPADAECNKAVAQQVLERVQRDVGLEPSAVSIQPHVHR